MKKLTFILLTFILSFLVVSCEENFSPKTEFTERYVVGCIVSSVAGSINSTIEAWVSKTYNIDGINPSKNTIDPTISNAKIKLFIGESEYILAVDTVKRTDTSKYKTPEIKYITSVVNPIPNVKLKILVNIDSSKTLSSETKLPLAQSFEYSYPFNHGITTNLERWKWGKSWIIYWTKAENHLYFPNLSISYSKLIDSNETFFTFNIPIEIKNTDGKEEPIYINYTYNSSIGYDYDAIDYAMRKISEGDSAKSNYLIYGINFSLTEFDQNLSNYYASTNGYLDNFSIKIDESVFSNINGGLGIFGSYFTNKSMFLADYNYARSFGYKAKF